MGEYSVTAYSRGHLIGWNEESRLWLYADDDSPITNDRPCAKCGMMPTAEGYDACLGHIDGAKHACCGHGVTEAYVIYEEEHPNE
jgi:hypothetical protein